jgi:MoaA/NifB/PqqE/SkfB family radical SAM enzyme
MKCYAPWHSILVRFNGDLVPDGVYTKRYGNLLESSLNDVLNSITASYTKDSMRNGVLPPECQQCALKEASVGHSRRLFFRDILNPMLEKTNYDYSKNFTDIYFLEFNMSNICNLKCRMCDGINSSAWVKDEMKLAEDGNILQRRINDPEFGYTNKSEQIIEKLFEDPTPLLNLRYLSIKGGEPYMEPANKKILQKFIDLGIAQNITLDWTTNGTIVDDEVHELARQYGHTKWTVSLEGTGDLYEYIRGGNNFTFAQLNENLKQYDFDRIIIAVTVMAYNIAHLDKIQNWYDSVKQENWDIYFNNVVAAPPYLNPRVLPNEILQSIEYKLPNINYTQSENSELYLQGLIYFTQRLDKIRNTNVLDYCPELTGLFEQDLTQGSVG